MTSRVVGIALVGLLCSVSIAAAQQRAWIGGFYGGYSTPTDAGTPDGGVSGMVNAFGMFTENLGAGIELGWHRLGTVDRTFFNADSTESSEGTERFGTWQTTGEVVVTTRHGMFRPYAEAGAGLYGVRVDRETLGVTNSETSTKFGFNAGAGLKFLWSEETNWGVGLDLRWHRIADVLANESEPLNVFSGMVGLNFN